MRRRFEAVEQQFERHGLRLTDENSRSPGPTVSCLCHGTTLAMEISFGFKCTATVTPEAARRPSRRRRPLSLSQSDVVSGSSRTPMFVALQHRNFRLLWLGQLISFSGSMMQQAGLL